MKQPERLSQNRWRSSNAPPLQRESGVAALERKQFTFYRSYYEALKTLPAKDFKAAVLAVCAYALDEEESSLSGVPHSVFTLIRPTLDSGRNKAQNRLNKKKSPNNKSTTNEKQTDIKSEQSGKENEGEKEREVESEKEREYEKEYLRILSPVGDNTRNPDSAAGKERMIESVLADYLNRVNPSASPASLDELRGYAETLGAEVCRRAFDVAIDEHKANWSYIRAILRDKEKRGVRCLADWDRLEQQRDAGRAAPKGGSSVPREEQDISWMAEYIQRKERE